jgi:hypothetical protein
MTANTLLIHRDGNTRQRRPEMAGRKVWRRNSTATDAGRAGANSPVTEPSPGRAISNAEVPQAKSLVRQVNRAAFPYQPIRGVMCLPPDCWNLFEFDFEPLDPSPGLTHARTLPPETAKVDQVAI